MNLGHWLATFVSRDEVQRRTQTCWQIALVSQQLESNLATMAAIQRWRLQSQFSWIKFYSGWFRKNRLRPSKIPYPTRLASYFLSYKEVEMKPKRIQRTTRKAYTKSPELRHCGQRSNASVANINAKRWWLTETNQFQAIQQRQQQQQRLQG